MRICPASISSWCRSTASNIREHLMLVAALGIDSEGFKHPLGLLEGGKRASRRTLTAAYYSRFAA